MITRFSALTKLMALLAMLAPGIALASSEHGSSHGDDESGIGVPGEAINVGRTIVIEMSDDMRYTPAHIAVMQGETVRLFITNQGSVRHELSLGSEQELQEHLELMRKYPDMVHDEPSKVTLEPGQQGNILWKFTKVGAVSFACLMPGHYEAGMRGAIKVSAASKRPITRTEPHAHSGHPYGPAGR